MTSQYLRPVLGLRSKIPAIAGAIALTLALINLSVVLGGPWHRDAVQVLEVFPGVLDNTQTAATATAGVLLMVLAAALARRKRRAWLVAVTLVSASLVLYALTLEHLTLAAVTHRPTSILLLLLLLVGRKEFVATTPGIPPMRAAVSLLVLAAIATVFGLALLVSRGCEGCGHVTLPSRLTMVWAGFAGIPNAFDSANTRAAEAIYYGLLGTGVALAFCALFLLLRTTRPGTGVSGADVERVHGLLSSTPTPDSLGYFALRPDKSVLWNEDGSAGIPYAVVDGVMLATGDPLGPEHLWPGLMLRFMATARDRAWIPGVASCSDRSRDIWSQAVGLRSFGIGDEAIIDTSAFSLDGRRMRNVRQMVNRARRTGTTITVHRSAVLSPADREELSRLADKWRIGRVERGHTMTLGRIGDARDANTVVVVARDGEDIQAFACFVPWGSDGLSLDLTRRHPESAPGLVESMLVEIIERAPELQVSRLSLNFVAFRQALVGGLAPNATVGHRLTRSMLLGLSRWVQIDSLYRFNVKFMPTWQPRFVLYGPMRDLPSILLALGRAEGIVPGRREPDRKPVVASVSSAQPTS